MRPHAPSASCNSTYRLSPDPVSDRLGDRYLAWCWAACSLQQAIHIAPSERPYRKSRLAPEGARSDRYSQVPFSQGQPYCAPDDDSVPCGGRRGLHFKRSLLVGSGRGGTHLYKPNPSSTPRSRSGSSGQSNSDDGVGARAAPQSSSRCLATAWMLSHRVASEFRSDLSPHVSPGARNPASPTMATVFSQWPRCSGSVGSGPMVTGSVIFQRVRYASIAPAAACHRSTCVMRSGSGPSSSVTWSGWV